MNKEITRAEFYEKYGDVEVTFSHYYKFTFSFSGDASDGSRVCVDVGGNSDDIYRFDVSAGDAQTVLSLRPYCGRVTKDGEEVESFYDY